MGLDSLGILGKPQYLSIYWNVNLCNFCTILKFKYFTLLTLRFWRENSNYGFCNFSIKCQKSNFWTQLDFRRENSNISLSFNATFLARKFKLRNWQFFIKKCQKSNFWTKLEFCPSVLQYVYVNNNTMKFTIQGYTKQVSFQKSFHQKWL